MARTVRKQLTQRAQDYWDTFTSEHGARVLADLQARFGQDAYVAGDTHETARRLGAQQVLASIRIELDTARGTKGT